MNLGGAIHLNKTGICIICGALLILFIYATANNSPTTENHDEQYKKRINLRELLQLAIKAAENGGEEVIETKDSIEIKSKGLTKEGVQDSVTTADFLSHCAILGTIKQIYPTLSVISEEAKTKCDDSRVYSTDAMSSSQNVLLPERWVTQDDVTVWIDPLDATKEYTEKLYEYVTTMVCVAVKGEPVIGVIHKPFHKAAENQPKTSWAWVGQDTSSNLKNKNVSVHDKLKIIISRSHSGDIKEILSGDQYNLVIAAGAGYKALEVATGNVDAYVHITAIKKWDICAGNAIINAVGGLMTTKFNENIEYEGSTSALNERGLVATLKNHKLFIDKLVFSNKIIN